MLYANDTLVKVQNFPWFFPPPCHFPGWRVALDCTVFLGCFCWVVLDKLSTAARPKLYPALYWQTFQFFVIFLKVKVAIQRLSSVEVKWNVVWCHSISGWWHTPDYANFSKTKIFVRDEIIEFIQFILIASVVTEFRFKLW